MSMDKPIKIFKPAGQQIDFFLRLHRHLPDRFCGGMYECKYRSDGIPINAANDYLEKLHKDSEFLRKEKEVEEAVKKQWRKIKLPPLAP